jgi:hypothetical protein
MRHAVHAAHENDHVNEEEPILPESRIRFAQECLERPWFLSVVTLGVFCTMSGFTFRFDDLEVVCFREIQTPSDEKDWRTGAEPEERSPAMGCCGNQSTIEHSREEISYGVALLEETRCYASRIVWQVFKGCRRGRTQESLVSSVPAIPRGRQNHVLTPMQMPYKARTARNGLKELQKPEASSRTMKRNRFATIKYLRPYLYQSACGI